MSKNPLFDLNCRRCPRLSQFLDEVGREYPDYHARPVEPFGVKTPKLLIVGLAPGMHGANATGRPFTGDYAGVLLYETLFKYGFSSKSISESLNDGLKLKHCRITNAVKCLPPQNKPTGGEVTTCNTFLQAEIASLPQQAGLLALGSVAHSAIIKALNLKAKDYPFGHARVHQPEAGPWIIDSYHCSRYNTQTRRLTEAMFHQVFALARERIEAVSV
ncbi:MAG: uracil-DNA glycosylase [Gammaproteobacteria bacterium]|nr:uracil-DNA glycosylase [Gammaproteobacteria bacterium]MDH5800536.1 uracil-DNA glycosylase [Gammaproteobacteria bacterium]